MAYLVYTKAFLQLTLHLIPTLRMGLANYNSCHVFWPVSKLVHLPHPAMLNLLSEATRKVCRG